MIVDLPTTSKSELTSLIRGTANDVSRSMKKWMEFSDYLLTLSDADLEALGFADASTRAYIGSFRVALLNLYEAYTNQAKSGSSDPSYVINALKNPITC